MGLVPMPLDIGLIFQCFMSSHFPHFIFRFYHVKSGRFGHQVNSDSDLVCLFYILMNKLTRQTVKNPDETAHKEPSHLDFHCLQMSQDLTIGTFWQ